MLKRAEARAPFKPGRSHWVRPIDKSRCYEMLGGNSFCMIGEYDVVIIGCGPGGSSAATFLARAGKRVLVLEKEVFPRFHIGESLLPCNMTIFREMGVLPALQAAGFPVKYGARFELGNGTLGTRFAFRQGKYNREPTAIQVER